jgi:hypothetical protein
LSYLPHQTGFAEIPGGLSEPSAGLLQKNVEVAGELDWRLKTKAFF